MIEPTYERLKKQKQNYQPVNFVRFNNAGENNKLEKMANGKYWKLNLELRYTVKETPQSDQLDEMGL